MKASHTNYVEARNLVEPVLPRGLSLGVLRSQSILGVTLIEMLIVLSITAILLGVGVVGTGAIARRVASQGAIATLQQSIWQGASAAASRGVTVHLERTENRLILQDVSNDRLLRSFDLPADVNIPVPNPILVFLPPGKVSTSSLLSLPEEFIIGTAAAAYLIEISIIGEVRASIVEN